MAEMISSDASCGSGDRDPGIFGPAPPGRPLLIWDGDCRFCERCVRHLRVITGDRVAYEPFQTAAERFPHIPIEQFRRAVVFVEPEGRTTHAAEAVMRALAVAPGRRWGLWIYRFIPGAGILLELGYRFVARNRDLATKLTRLFVGGLVGPPRFQLTRWIFLRLLGLIFLSAFISAGRQVHGLIGEHGITPAADLLDAIRATNGSDGWLLLPTLCWFGASDAMLSLLCWGGAIASSLLVIGLLQAPMVALCFVFYLSLVNADQVFLTFQWDILLCETAFLAIFLAPWQALPRRPHRERPPSVVVIWLMRLLLFKLMFSSGVTKLTWHDPTWNDLSALTFHYWSQPIPTPLAWYAHQLPVPIQRLSCLVMFIIEIGLPFLFFLPRRPRVIACAGTAALMALIAATGNYGFFNLLALALCVLLLDDAHWPRPLRSRLLDETPEPLRPRRLRALVIAPLTVLILLLSRESLGTIWNRPQTSEPRLTAVLHRSLRPWRINSDYGLFRTMTTTRPEIEIQGSDDGEAWLTYVFRYKPGDPARAPRLFMPHMPRLDWRMWFAALGAERMLGSVGPRGMPAWFQRQDAWMRPLCIRLLEGEESVLALFEENPFPDAPPRALRLVLWSYRFTDLGDESGDWWRREGVGVIVGPLSLPGRDELPNLSSPSASTD